MAFLTNTNMKKILIAALFIGSITACHYGQNEAKETLERNDQYKTDKADYSVNRAGEGGKMNATAAPAEPAAPADTATKAEAPAAAPEHK